jgi:hypothetical protein
VLTAWAAVALLVPLVAPGASPKPVYPDQGSGFAAYIVGGFFGLGILILFMIWTSRRPKRPS